MVQGVQRAGRRHLPRRVALATLPLQFAFGLSYTWGALAPYVRRDAHWSAVALGLGFAAVPIGYAAGIAVGGRLADRVPPRRLCWTGMGLLAGGLAAGLLVHTALVLIVLYAGIGLGVGGGIALAGALGAGAQAFPQRLGTISGALTGIYAGAAVVQAPIISRLAAQLSWVAALRLVGVTVWLLGAAALLLLPPLPRPERPRDRSPAAGAVHSRYRVWSAILIQFSVAPLGSYATSHIALFAHDLALAAWVGAAGVATLAAGNGLGRLVGGVSSDRFGVDRVLLVIIAVDLLAALLLWQTVNTATLLVAASGLGLAFGGQVGLISRLAADGAPEAPHTAFGLLFAAFALGAFAGAVLGPLLGDGRRVWLLLAACTLVGLAMVMHRLTVRTFVPVGSGHNG